MRRVSIIAHGKIVMFLEDQEVQGDNGNHSKEEWQENSSAPLPKQRFPGSFPDGKINAHSGYVKQQRNPPNIQHSHRFPQNLHRFWAPDKSDKHGPGLENDRNVVDQEKSDRDHPQPVNIVSSFRCHWITC